MNIRKIVLSILIFSFVFSAFADNTTDISLLSSDNTYTGDVKKDGVNDFLNSCVGMDISVTISNVDNTITGKLISVYKDGIYLKTAFNNYVYIMKSSVSYYKVTGYATKK